MKLRFFRDENGGEKFDVLEKYNDIRYIFWHYINPDKIELSNIRNPKFREKELVKSYIVENIDDMTINSSSAFSALEHVSIGFDGTSGPIKAIHIAFKTPREVNVVRGISVGERWMYVE